MKQATGPVGRKNFGCYNLRRKQNLQRKEKPDMNKEKFKKYALYFLVGFIACMVITPVFDYLYSLITSSAWALDLGKDAAESAGFALLFALVFGGDKDDKKKKQ